MAKSRLKREVEEAITTAMAAEDLPSDYSCAGYMADVVTDGVYSPVEAAAVLRKLANACASASERLSRTAG